MLITIHNSDVADIGETDAVVIAAVGADRGTAIRAALMAKKPFALNGIEYETSQQLEHLAKSAKKSHVKCCWLGSFRFISPVAKLKEIISGGTAGNLQSLKIQVTGKDFWRAGAEDLGSWLTEDAPCMVDVDFTTDNTLTVNIEMTADNMTANLEFSDVAEVADLRLEFSDGRTRIFEGSIDFKAELKYLESVFTHGNPWNSLPQITKHHKKGKEQ